MNRRPSPELADASRRLAASAAATAALWGGLVRRDQRLAGVASAYLSFQVGNTLARRWVRILRADVTEAFQEEVRAALASGYIQLVSCGVPPTALGMHAYVLRTRLTPPVTRHMWRQESVRLGVSPRRTSIRWTRGKGVIGRAWAENQMVLLNAAEAYGPYEGCDADTWAQAEIADELNLSYDEFSIVGNRYSTVAAVPVRVDGEVRGCVVADVLIDADGAALLDEAAQQVLADVGVVIEVAMSQLPRWPYR